MKEFVCQGLVGYCFSCSNFARWDDEKQNMVCMAYHDGIPDSMWQRVEQGKDCLWRNKDRLEIEIAERKKQMEHIFQIDIPEEEKIENGDIPLTDL